MTNYENIKSMSVEEMAEYFANHSDCSMCSYRTIKCVINETVYCCYEGIRQWLEQEVTDK